MLGEDVAGLGDRYVPWWQASTPDVWRRTPLAPAQHGPLVSQAMLEASLRASVGAGDLMMG